MGGDGGGGDGGGGLGGGDGGGEGGGGDGGGGDGGGGEGGGYSLHSMELDDPSCIANIVFGEPGPVGGMCSP